MVSAIKISKQQEQVAEAEQLMFAAQAERNAFFKSMTPEDVANWVMNIPDFEIPTGERYNKILNCICDVIIVCKMDGLVFDSILREGRMEDFKVMGAHTRSFIGRRIEKVWILDFYTDAEY